MINLRILVTVTVLLGFTNGQTNDLPCGANKREAVGILYDELRNSLAANNVTLIDVRTREELQADGQIPGSFNIPMNELVNAFNLRGADFIREYGFKKPSPELASDVVISCEGGIRALDAWKILANLGYCDARVYYGSFGDWVSSGGQVVKAN